MEAGTIAERKAVLRREMRALRRNLPDRPERSQAIAAHLAGLAEFAAAARLLLYDEIVGEVIMAPVRDWCAARSMEVAVPEDDVDPAWPDVIVVPGLAFTTLGERLGQGGGWYDRFLPHRRDDAVTIGVTFAPQIVESIPLDVHDVILDCIVTEDGARWGDAHRRG
ncbi:MAG: 5-formyltetrahydrofolate cyclo-ligase [Ilumatobacter sp.]|jgi:5-formyltetrahydrofolate cyclo-ligase|uniref:5-formyltetrahydrofolate cyclo-ligase n=1 Tax=Ilumatobacter sp. TaxID=1967498 RepID=UPI00391BDD68